MPFGVRCGPSRAMVACGRVAGVEEIMGFRFVRRGMFRGGGADALLGSRIATPGFLPGAIRCPSCLGAGRVPARWRGGAWWLENWIVDASKTRVFESLFCC